MSEKIIHSFVQSQKLPEEPEKKKIRNFSISIKFVFVFEIALIPLVLVLALGYEKRIPTQVSSARNQTRADVGFAYVSTKDKDQDESLARIASNFKDLLVGKSVRLVGCLADREPDALWENAQKERCQTILRFSLEKRKLPLQKHEIILALEWFHAMRQTLEQSESVSLMISDCSESSESKSILELLPVLENQLRNQFRDSVEKRTINPDWVMARALGITEQQAIENAQLEAIKQDMSVVISSQTQVQDFVVVRHELTVRHQGNLPPVMAKRVRKLCDGNFEATIWCASRRPEIGKNVLNDERIRPYLPYIGTIFLYEKEATWRGNALEQAVIHIQNEVLHHGFEIYKAEILKERFEALQKTFDTGLPPDWGEEYKKRPTPYIVLLKQLATGDDKKLTLMLDFYSRTGKQLETFVRESVISDPKNMFQDVKAFAENVLVPDLLDGMVREASKYAKGKPSRLEFLGFTQEEQKSIRDIIYSEYKEIFYPMPGDMPDSGGYMQVEVSYQKEDDPLTMLENELANRAIYSSPNRMNNWIRFVKTDCVYGIPRTYILVAVVGIWILFTLVLVILLLRRKKDQDF